MLSDEAAPNLVFPPLRPELLRLPSRAPPALVPYLEREDEAHRAVVRNHRSLLKEAAVTSETLMHAAKRSRALSVRAEWDAHTGKDVAKQLDVDMHASEEVPLTPVSACLPTAYLIPTAYRLRTGSALVVLTTGSGRTPLSLLAGHPQLLRHPQQGHVPPLSRGAHARSVLPAVQIHGP